MPLDFKKLVCARFLFTFAVQMQAVVLGWRIYEILKDPLYLGLIGLTEAVPALGLALFAGYLVDRMRPIRVYQGVIMTSFLSGLLVLVEHVFQENFPVSTQVGLLYGAAFLTGLARSFAGPAIFSTTPRIVDRPNLLQGIATMSSAMQIARIGGPATGGVVFALWGPIVSSSIVCALLLCAVVAMALIKINIPPSPGGQHKSVADELLSGVRFVFQHPLLFPALTLDMISVLFGGVTALLPIFANEILFVGPKGLGALRAAPAVGAAVTGIFLARNRNSARTGGWLLWSVGGFGFCILLFGVSQNFYLSMVALVMSGAFDSISMVIRSSTVQLSSPDHMRGKISAVNSIFIGSSNELGELESGIAAKLLGTVPSVYLGGFVCLLTVATVSYFSPALRQLDLKKLANQP